jgi:hypothetical protein
VSVATGPSDSSAAAIAAFGLLRLAALSADPVYAQTAREALHALAGARRPCQATAGLPHGLGVDASTIYGNWSGWQVVDPMGDGI